VRNSQVSLENKVVQNGNQLELLKEGSQEQFTVTLGDVISRDPVTIGRSTVVLKATSDQWPKKKLVVKVSWPTTGRVSESDFLKKALEEAENAEGRWATKHLPHMFWAGDIEFGTDSTFGSVTNLFEGAKFVGDEFVYERRALRVIIQEELHPLKSLGDVKEIGQVFVDVVCGACPLCFSSTGVHSGHSSSPLAPRSPWDPSSRP
jgi:hypothetical protein